MAVTAASTMCSPVRPARSSATPPTASPTAMPPPDVMTSDHSASVLLPILASVQLSASPNSTAATPSLNRLSLSTSRRKRPPRPVSLNMAITATGSVAAISTPNTRADTSGQPSTMCMPAVTTIAETATPTMLSTSTGTMSRRNSCQGIFSAASNSSGGRITSNIMSWVSATPVSMRPKVRAAPARISPTV